MPNMTLAIPEDLKDKMDRFKEINWSEVARQAIREKTQLLERMNQMLAGSALNDASIKASAARIKKNVSKKHKMG
ncbi:MAG: hypothetical protein A3C36_01655 [Omnitrophica WOR_2 bacterium RIFCSPHIGHO2_02_FULL_52_10]|nr:MAG: hypothetical protein A3C36_01655 [Omnitrophica WOR_2 bacterium RIFCSPHIGHO2_02_FULL_52_10]